MSILRKPQPKSTTPKYYECLILNGSANFTYNFKAYYMYSSEKGFYEFTDEDGNIIKRLPISKTIIEKITIMEEKIVIIK